MKLATVGAERAYKSIREKIVTLELAPGSVINEQQLAAELSMAESAIRDALKLLVHDNLVRVTQRHGLHVADVNVPDLEQISEMRVELEGLCARLAAQRATADDLTVMETLRREQTNTPPEDSRRLLELDQQFHQAVAKAAGNKYLAETLERFYGLSLRLWNLALPRLHSLASQIQLHHDLLEAIEAHDAGRAEAIMCDHVSGFYAQVRQVLQAGEE